MCTATWQTLSREDLDFRFPRFTVLVAHSSSTSTATNQIAAVQLTYPFSLWSRLLETRLYEGIFYKLKTTPSEYPSRNYYSGIWLSLHPQTSPHLPIKNMDRILQKNIRKVGNTLLSSVSVNRFLSPTVTWKLKWIFLFFLIWKIEMNIQRKQMRIPTCFLFPKAAIRSLRYALSGPHLKHFEPN